MSYLRLYILYYARNLNALSLQCQPWPEASDGFRLKTLSTTREHTRLTFVVQNSLLLLQTRGLLELIA
jgi:hypothetical protein